MRAPGVSFASYQGEARVRKILRALKYSDRLHVENDLSSLKNNCWNPGELYSTSLAGHAHEILSTNKLGVILHYSTERINPIRSEKLDTKAQHFSNPIPTSVSQSPHIHECPTVPAEEVTEVLLFSSLAWRIEGGPFQL